MSIEQNKATARRWSEELWGKGNLAVADEIIAPEYVRHDPGDPFPARGPEDVKRIVTMLRTTLPDLRIQIEAMVAEDDMVVSRYTTTATDTRLYGKATDRQDHPNLRYARCSDSPTAKSLRAGRHATIWVSWCSWDICRQWVHRKMSQKDLSVEPGFTRELLSNPADGLR